MSKLATAEAAAELVGSGATVAVDGAGGGVNDADAILAALEQRFLASGEPRDLTLLAPNGLGDGRGGGMERFAHRGMVKRTIGGHWGWSREMQRMAADEEIEAYCLPQGVLSHLMRAIAGARPGVVTHIGLGTFADPRRDGGTLNERSPNELVELIELAGREWLFYKAFPVDVAVIRGSRADERGNLTMDDEGLYAETLSTAQAAKNSGGIVLAQAKQIVPAGDLDPRRVKVPGVLVDALVLNPDQALSCEFDADPGLTGERRVAVEDIPGMTMSPRKLIARRAAHELRAGEIVNLGYGLPDGVSSVLAEEGVYDQVTFTLEQGHIGGLPVTGDSFGLARNQEAIVDAGYQFDWYDGGGLDSAVLSFAEIDASGNVNVGKFAGRLPGVGGFVNISQGARRVVFVGTFSVGARIELTDRTVQIAAEGRPKLVREVQQVAFSGDYAARWGKQVVYVTERAVFELTLDGLLLVELAPGVDLERDVLGQMGFEPIVSADLRTMDARLLSPGPMGLELTQRAGVPA